MTRTPSCRMSPSRNASSLDRVRSGHGGSRGQLQSAPPSLHGYTVISNQAAVSASMNLAGCESPLRRPWPSRHGDHASTIRIMIMITTLCCSFVSDYIDHGMDAEGQSRFGCLSGFKLGYTVTGATRAAALRCRAFLFLAYFAYIMSRTAIGIQPKCGSRRSVCIGRVHAVRVLCNRG
jgi:hypothetical protein